jgi:Uma2 family endonuclease
MPTSDRTRKERSKERSGKMTTAEYLLTPETVLPRELAFGVMRVAESPSASHQRVVRDLLVALVAFVREQDLGEVLPAPMDVILDRDAALVVQPDLLFVSHGRSRLITDLVEGPPDLVVEVLSPFPRIGRIEERVGWFARYGVRECWLADLTKKQIAVLTFAEGHIERRALFERAQPVQSGVLAGFRITPLQLFGW